MDVFILSEKQGERIVNADDPEKAALFILNKRFDEGWYDNWDDGDPNNQWEDNAKTIINSGDGKSALRFLRERNDHEYEGIEFTRIIDPV